MITDVAILTDKGLLRTTNQDAVYGQSDGKFGLFVVADGMGGHSQGDIASSVTVRRLAEWWNQLNKTELSINAVTEQLTEQIQSINKLLYQKFSETEETGGTTLCVLIIWQDVFCMESVGDSRIYGSLSNSITQLTTDDIWENQEKIKNSYKKEELIQDKRFGKLTQAVGSDAGLDIHVMKGIILKPMTFLLCSDGAYRYHQGLSANPPRLSMRFCSAEKMVNKMQKEIIRNGAKDNYSMIVLKCQKEKN